MSEKIKVLFVCLGNICRSPTAEGVFRTMVEKSGTFAFEEVFGLCAVGTSACAVHGDSGHDRNSKNTDKTRG